MNLYGLILVFLLLSFAFPAFAALQAYAALLCVPVAAYAGQRHGWRGVEAVLLGGILLPIGLRGPFGAFPPELDIYLLAIAAAMIAASRRPLREFACEPRATLGFAAAFALLPLSIPVAREPLDSGIDVTVSVALLPLLYFLLFLFGLARGRSALVIVSLSLATVAGIALALSLESYRWRYQLDTPADLLTGLGWFYVGHYLRGLLDGQPTRAVYEIWPRATLAGLLALSCAHPLWSLLERAGGDLEDLVVQLAPVGNFYALPLAALFAGLRFRFRGAMVVTVTALAVELAGPALRLYGANLGVPAVAFGFAVLGTYMGDHARGVKTVWYPWHWTAYALSAAISVTLLLGAAEADSVYDIGEALALLAALIALGAAGKHLLQRAGALLQAESLQGWVAAAATVFLLLGMLSNLEAFWSAVTAAFAGVYFGFLAFRGDSFWEPDTQTVLATGAVLYITALFTVAAKGLESLPPLVEDAGRLRAWITASRRAPGVLPTTAPPRKTNSALHRKAPRRGLERAIQALRWLRNGAALAAAILILLLVLDAG